MEKKLPLILLIIIISLFKVSSVQAQTCPTVPTNTGTVTFSTTTTAGTYRVWSRMKALDTNNNSFYLKIDNNCAILVGDSSQVSSSNWTWVDYQNGNTSTKINATLTAGNHVITLIGNEPGVSVDKVLLTKNLSCVPIDFGANCPAELPISTPTPTLVPTAVPTAVPTPTPTSAPTPVPGSFSQYIEAENFTLSLPMTKSSDTRAWNGQYISPTTGVDSEIPVREAYASISLSTSGNYYLWARMMGPANANDALYLGFDNSWDRKVPGAIGAYEWIRVRNYASNLTAGSHIIQIGHGEINARLDTVFVTNDANATPIQSTPTPTPIPACPTLPTNTGTVTFSTTTTAGTYRVWSRMKALDTNNNSFYLKIDNNCAILVGDSSQVSSSNWTWVDYQNGNTSTKINATLTAGNHVITLIGNEPGVSVDKVLLTKNLSCVPIDFGANCPAELPISTPTPTPGGSTPTPIPASTYSQVILNTSSLVAYWRLGETSGNPQDSKGTNHVAVVNGTPTYSQTGAIAGDGNTSILLDGTTEYFSVPDAAPLDLGDAPWTFEVWAQRSATGADHALFSKSTGTPWVGVSTNKLTVNVYGGLKLIEQTGTFPTDLDFHHCVATFDGTTAKLYIDGVDVSGATADQTFSSNNDSLNISSNAEFWPGKLDEAAIYNTVLSLSQVQAHYNAAFQTPTPTPLPTPTPTPLPTPSPILTPTPTPTPIPTPTPSPNPGDTLLTLGIGLDGIWNSGTHTYTNGSLSTKNPKHQSRTFVIDIIDKNNNPVVQGKAGTLTYDSAKGYFGGTINLGSNFTNGSYLVKVRTDGYLKKLLPGIQNIITETTNALSPRINLVTGDISGENSIDIKDYNILISCLNGPDVETPSGSTKLCNAKYQTLSDLDDNGVVDQIDLNLFLAEYSAQNGD